MAYSRCLIMKNKPRIRFKGFAEDWEQRKLGEVVKSYSGGTPTASNKEYYGGDIPFIRSAEINSDTTELYITQKGLDNSSAKIVEKGTILYAMYGATSGEVGISKINGAINQAILAMIPLNYDGKIIAQYLRKNKESIIGKYLQGGQGNLSANIILELPIQLPGLEESNQIAYFLESVDNIITLHQRKLEKLKLAKKALLQKLFPKNGSQFPEIRFKGFTDAWEQRKLSEVVTINPKTELPDEFKYVDLESVVGTNLLGFQVIKKENAPSRAQRLASYGDVFYQTVRPYQRNNYLFENVDKDMVFSTGYAQLRSKLDSYFLLTLVQNDNFVKVVLDNCTGTSYPAINGSELGKITVQIPSNEVEANQIGKVFRGIDKSITLHQRKLDKLQEVKKGLLQKMFV